MADVDVEVDRIEVVEVDVVVSEVEIDVVGVVAVVKDVEIDVVGKVVVVQDVSMEVVGRVVVVLVLAVTHWVILVCVTVVKGSTIIKTTLHTVMLSVAELSVDKIVVVTVVCVAAAAKKVAMQPTQIWDAVDVVPEFAVPAEDTIFSR